MLAWLRLAEQDQECRSYCVGRQKDFWPLYNAANPNTVNSSIFMFRYTAQSHITAVSARQGGHMGCVLAVAMSRSLPFG